MSEEYHPNLDGPAEPVGLSMGDDPAYQKFVEDCAAICQCSGERPCEGLLSGGICDGIGVGHDNQTEDDEE